MDKKTRVLFLCTGNSCRSQMAEGWMRHLKNDTVDVYSAGTETRDLDPDAVLVMAEAGVDISRQESTNVKEYLSEEFDYVITICSDAEKNCPVFPARTRVIHRGFDDPPRLAGLETDRGKALSHYRRVRDEIRSLVEQFPSGLE